MDILQILSGHYSLQEVLDFTTQKLREQGGPSFDHAGGMCLYRGEGGAKCAIGHLIPDASYRKEFEEKGIVALLGDPSLNFIARGDESDEMVQLLEDLQSVHDHAARAARVNSVTEWNELTGETISRDQAMFKSEWDRCFEQGLIRVCNRYSLQYKAPN